MPPLTPSGARGAAIGLVAIALVTAVLVAFASAHRALGVNADESIYLLLADYFSAWFGRAAPPAEFVWRFNQFPPLYPLLLAAVGAGSAHAVLARVLTAGCAGLAALACVRWLAAAGIGTPATRPAVALLWLLLPYTVFIAVDARSETLYGFASMMALANMSGAARGQERLGIAACWVVIATLTRIVGLSLLAAFVCWAWRSGAASRGRWIAIAVLCVLSWMLFRTLWLHPEQDYLMDAYTRYRGRPVALVAATLTQGAIALWHGWQGLFDITHRPWAGLLSGVPLLLGGAGMLAALRRGQVAAWYGLAYLTVILVWPYPDHAARFLWPLAPLLLGFALQFIQGIGPLPPVAARALALLAGVACLAPIAPGWRHLAGRYFEPIPAALQDYRGSELWLVSLPTAVAASNVRLIALVNSSMAASAGFVPAGGCIFSAHPERMMLLARRPSRPPPVPATPAAVFDADMQACGHAHVVFTTGHPTFPPGYPAARLSHARAVARFDLPVAGRPQTVAALLELR